MREADYPIASMTRKNDEVSRSLFSGRRDVLFSHHLVYDLLLFSTMVPRIAHLVVGYCSCTCQLTSQMFFIIFYSMLRCVST